MSRAGLRVLRPEDPLRKVRDARRSAVTLPSLSIQAHAAGFMEPGERTWQLRYAYDFTALGVPGLTFSTRYNHGDHANPATHAGEGHV